MTFRYDIELDVRIGDERIGTYLDRVALYRLKNVSFPNPLNKKDLITFGRVDGKRLTTFVESVEHTPNNDVCPDANFPENKSLVRTSLYAATLLPNKLEIENTLSDEEIARNLDLIDRCLVIYHPIKEIFPIRKD